MTNEEREATQKVVRVGINLGVLLDIGLFAGQHAVGLQECRELVKGLVVEAQGRLNALTPAPASPGSGPAAPALTPPPLPPSPAA